MCSFLCYFGTLGCAVAVTCCLGDRPEDHGQQVLRGDVDLSERGTAAKARWRPRIRRAWQRKVSFLWPDRTSACWRKVRGTGAHRRYRPGDVLPGGAHCKAQGKHLDERLVGQSHALDAVGEKFVNEAAQIAAGCILQVDNCTLLKRGENNIEATARTSWRVRGTPSCTCAAIRKVRSFALWTRAVELPSLCLGALRLAQEAA